ncbi:hypothetical protein OG689_35475 [Kitasatospora sp. NBC_00240]|uniref:hypothetical protein n=1 Tax=Kitasatospora sp. NBC_00240 TaxID=2903567 RepID=UPI002254F09C|nr:hypothetical protein [Kitasatospora sp. NBC_00240]MCX5214501.1 hypothetical protein [Kitasatospora sp. NBC_00240]
MHAEGFGNVGPALGVRCIPSASGYTGAGMYPSAAACESAGKAYVTSGQAVTYDTAPNTARLSVRFC